MSLHPLLHSFAYGLDYLREQVADVARADMVAQPAGIRNHPAWTIGHITLICQEIGAVIGLPAWLPADWHKRYGPGSDPSPDTARYEAKEVALAKLADAQSRVTQAVTQALEAAQSVRRPGLEPALDLDQPFPDAAYLEVFPTIRHALFQVLVAHTAFHVGQIAAWRRAMHLPPVARGFE